METVDEPFDAVAGQCKGGDAKKFCIRIWGRERFIRFNDRTFGYAVPGVLARAVMTVLKLMASGAGGPFAVLRIMLESKSTAELRLPIAECAFNWMLHATRSISMDDSRIRAIQESTTSGEECFECWESTLLWNEAVGVIPAASLATSILTAAESTPNPRVTFAVKPMLSILPFTSWD